MHFFTWVKQLKRWWGDDDDKEEGYLGENENSQGYAEISHGFGSISVCVCVCGITHNIDIVLNDFISARRREREGGEARLFTGIWIYLYQSLPLSVCLCVCRACCIRICSIMTQITSAHCLLRAAQVDITTRRVYVICCYFYLCFCFFLLSYFLCFCLFRAKKRPLWWLAKLVRISFHVHPQGVCQKQDLPTLPHTEHTFIYTQPHTPNHTHVTCY